MQTQNKMNKLHYEILKTINELCEENGINPNEIPDVIDETIESAATKTAKSMFEIINKDMPKILRAKRKEIKSFEKVHQKRWRRCLELLELQLVISEEISQEFHNNFDQNNEETDNALDYTSLEALHNLHTRAVLVGREILCLLRAGYADGALARWRSLHEIAVIISFICIAENRQEISTRYILSREVQALKSMKDFNKYVEKAKPERFSDEEIQYAKERSEKIKEKYGKELENDYGWAYPTLNNKKPQLIHLEQHTGLDYWRPRFKWASNYIHGNFKPHDTLLGLSEVNDNDDIEFYLTGPSYSGITDPGHMTSISLLIATTHLLTTMPIIDHMISIKTLSILTDEIELAFYSVEQN